MQVFVKRLSYNDYSHYLEICYNSSNIVYNILIRLVSSTKKPEIIPTEKKKLQNNTFLILKITY